MTANADGSALKGGRRKAESYEDRTQEDPTMWFCRQDSPLGRLLMTSDGSALTGLYFDDGRDVPVVGRDWREDGGAEPFEAVRQQLTEYFEGQRTSFDLSLRPRGTDFQQRIWQVIAQVPFGELISYRELATRAGSPQASRAAGLATGRNPISIIIPCHRIVGSSGSLTGYGGGLPRKRMLLDLETSVVQRERPFELRSA
jgi:methylated-DNA-[protein]-cysteine S-methyltransferase